MPDCIPYYESGLNLSAIASAPVTGCRCVKISGDRQVGGAGNGKITVAHALAGGRICGVAARDAAAGGRVSVIRGSGLVLPIAAGGDIGAFSQVEVGADGMVVAQSSGFAIGYVLTGAASGGFADVSLY